MLEKKTKIVSNLNLQFLDAKFIAVKPQDEQEQSMQLIRRNRASELPSIVRSFMQDTTGIEETDSLVLTALKNSHDNSSRLDNSSLMVLDQEK